jgi:hypothetical protein
LVLENVPRGIDLSGRQSIQSLEVVPATKESAKFGNDLGRGVTGFSDALSGLSRRKVLYDPMRSNPTSMEEYWCRIAIARQINQIPKHCRHASFIQRKIPIRLRDVVAVIIFNLRACPSCQDHLGAQGRLCDGLWNFLALAIPI